MTAFWVVLLCVAAIYGVLSHTPPEKRRYNLITRRSAMSFDEVFQQCFRESGFSKDVLEGLWNEAATDLELDPLKLRPTDRFDRELGDPCFPHVELAVDLNNRLWRRLKILPRSQWPKEVVTLGDYIIVSANLKQRGAGD